MIETIVYNYLTSKMPDIAIGFEIPATHSDSFIVIQKVASGIDNHINAATLEFHCYAPSKYEAASLDEELKTAMLGNDTTYGIASLNTISSCKYGGGNDAPNTNIKAYRYRSYYNLFY